MRGDLKNNLASSRLLQQLVLDKKKAIFALSLICVMGFMWIKVLVGGEPAGAKAAMTKEITQENKQQEVKIGFIDLPEVKGRNDVLSRDFFDVDARSLIGTEVDIIFSDENDGVGVILSEELKLEAIAMGRQPQAFINDKLLVVGDEFFVSNEVSTYECEVIGIEENKVFIKCGETEIVLKLLETEASQ